MPGLYAQHFSCHSVSIKWFQHAILQADANIYRLLEYISLTDPDPLLVNWFWNEQLDVIFSFLQDLEAKLGRDYPSKDVPAEVNATAKAGLDVIFLNSAVDATGNHSLNYTDI